MITHELIDAGSLTSEGQQLLIERVARVYRQHGHGASDEDISRRLFGCPQTFIDLLVLEGCVIAFGVCVLKPLKDGETCLWRHGIVVDSHHQSQGHYKRLLAIALKRHMTAWTATQTQNPWVYETWLKIFGDSLYPHPDKTLSVEVQTVAGELAEKPESFDPTTLVIRGAYTEDRSRVARQQGRTEWVTRFFASRLGVYDTQVLLVKR